MSGVATCSVRAFGTDALVATTDLDGLATARAILVRTLRALDLACSRFRGDSELTRLNAAAGRPTHASELLRATITAAVSVAATTDGLVDPTVGRALRQTGYDRTIELVRNRDGRLVRPTYEQAGHWREIEVDDDRETVTVPAGVELDLGAAAKALAADRIAAAVAGTTGGGALASLGGDIATAGPTPAGGWVVGIDEDHRAEPDRTTVRISLASGGLASSSTRLRSWETSDGRAHHILDPGTGRPAATVWAMVSVAAASCLDANAASTAAIVLGEAAPGWLAARSLPARLVRGHGKVVTVGGWPAPTPS